MFKFFLSGFLSVFQLASIKRVKFFDIAGYFYQIENDINKSYQELREDERE